VNPDLSDAIAASWSFPLWATLGLLLTAMVYWRGWRVARLTRPAELPPWRAGCFFAGLATIWLAIASPLDVLGDWLLLAHMAQHLLLMSVAPPLLLLGAPTVPLLRGVPRPWVHDGLGPLFTSRTVHVIARFLTHPATGWIAMNVAYLGWHVPAAYELGLRSPAWHEVEHACFLFTSLLFWWTVLQPWPSRTRWSRWAVVPYLVTADLANTALSAFLAFSNRVLYPTYAAAPRIFGLSPMQDQAAAGAFMWVVGSAIYLVPAIGVTMSLLSRRQSRSALVGSRSALVGSRHALVTIGGAPAAGKIHATGQPFDLLRVPVIGALLRAHYGRQSLQAISLLLMCMVIADGFVGHPMAAMNLAGVLPWNILRALGVLALLFAGNLFCMACPFTLPRELGRRLGWARLRWPQWLRMKWIGVGLMVAFFFGYERFGLWASPARTAWLLVAYAGTALLVDTLFRGASFCKYVCPIGQFNFIGSLIAPTALQVRSASTCGTCATRDCIRGNTQQRGCELELYLPEKRSNADCTMCMDCVKACPHDNVGILTRSMTQDVLAVEPTSSLGRLSRRTDVAAAALVLVLAAFANAAAMVKPGAAFLAAAGRRVPWLATSMGSFAGVLAAAMLAAGVVWMAAQTARGVASRREAFGRGALALVPLGMGMWAAHLLFHLAMGVPGLLPLVRQVGLDFGFHWLGAPQWGAGTSLLQANGLLQLQLLFLDGGLLLSLYLAWRMATATRVGQRLLAVAPMALLTVALYCIGFWLLLQPMQMRGVMMGAM
jgi:cytochrome c oxidase assembly factor CtaG/ferredoxin